MILISCSARLAVFDIAELREITSYDELELDTLDIQEDAEKAAQEKRSREQNDILF